VASVYNFEMMETVVFGGGCFWCIEAVFKMLKGVISVTPGYAGGTADNPTYLKVVWGNTGHAEVIKVEYDPTAVSFKNLLTVFFGSHDPTSVNRQGPDVGEEYRSLILYTAEEQKNESEKFIEEINASNKDGRPVTTEVKPLQKFFPAESYHLDYYKTHKGNRYCELVINPKLEKVQKGFASLLRNSS